MKRKRDDQSAEPGAAADEYSALLKRIAELRASAAKVYESARSTNAASGGGGGGGGEGGGGGGGGA